MIDRMKGRFPEAEAMSSTWSSAPMEESACRLFRARMRAVTRRLEAAASESKQTAEEIHQLRVTTRRATAALAVFRPWLKRSHRAKAKRSLERLRDAAGAVRRGDVHRSMLSLQLDRADAEAQPVLEALRVHVEREREKAMVRWRDAVSRRRLRQWKRVVRRLRESMRVAPDRAPARATLRDAAALVLPRLQAVFALAAGMSMEGPAGVHRLRIVSKRLRYAMELLDPALERPVAEALMGLSRQLQDHLGPINDLSELLDIVEHWRAGLADDATTNGHSEPGSVSAGESLGVDLPMALGVLAQLYRDELTARLGRFQAWWSRGANSALANALEAAVVESARAIGADLIAAAPRPPVASPSEAGNNA
jgi:CHAD domain-containing protein